MCLEDARFSRLGCTSMVDRQLTNALIESGRSLIQTLDDAKVEVDAALWFYFPDIESWKLIISVPRLIKKGPREAYEAIQKAARKLERGGVQVPLSDVTVAKKNTPLLDLLRVAVRTGPGISGVRFTQNVINGNLVEDAYIYRLV